MPDSNLLVVALAVLAFGVLGGRLSGTPLTMPMVFTGAGILLGPPVLGILDFDVGSDVVSALAEATLVVVLFTDASRMDLRRVIAEHTLAQRLLLLGLPLAILLGTGAGMLLFPALPVVSVALLAVVLAPTDAALGQAFVANRSVPARIRQTLNVESGLNDGLGVPFLTVLIDVARDEADTVLSYVGLFARLIGVGVVVGAGVAWLGGRLLTASDARGWTSGTTQRLATVAVAAVAYAGAELLGGNGFVAAFVAGLVIGTTARSLLSATTEFAEAEGELLALLTFLLFGSVVAADVLGDLSWQVAAYSLASLLLVRPLAVAISLLGTRLSLRSIAFIGWAGPRGLASIVYAVIVADAGRIEGADLVFAVAAWTVLASIVLHGVSAAPLARRYASHMAARPDRAAPEHRPVGELPLRLRSS